MRVWNSKGGKFFFIAMRTWSGDYRSLRFMLLIVCYFNEKYSFIRGSRVMGLSAFFNDEERGLVRC